MWQQNLALLGLLTQSTFWFYGTCDQTDQQILYSSPQNVRNIAIIGGGAAGSSAAYYLHQFSQDLTTNINITIFDANSRIGGRTTTVNVFDDPEYPVELGASIFVKVNHILLNLSRDFDLQTHTKIFEAGPDTKYDLGIWDGSNFVFKQTNDDQGRSFLGPVWEIGKLLWKYGLSPIRAQRLMKTVVGKFLGFYDSPIFPFATIQDAVNAAQLSEYTGITGDEVLTNAGVSQLFSRDLVQASTRVNYAQNLGGIHGVEALVCLATDGAMAVEGGNWQIFAEAVKRSEAHIRLNTTVDTIEKTKRGSFNVHVRPSQSSSTPPSSHPQNTPDLPSFDTIILAAPYQFSDITFQPPLSQPPEYIPYVSLYVTLFTSPHRLSPKFFNLTDTIDVPGSILTTLPPGLDLGSARGIDAVGPTNFWSISTLRVLPPIPSDPTFKPQYLYKIFSPQQLKAAWLASLLDIDHIPTPNDPISETTKDGDLISTLPKEDLTWFHEKLWHSYPYETPRTKFDLFEFYLEKSNESDQTINPQAKIWYTSSMEPFISTMETSALSGMNVARLVVDEFLREEQLSERK